MTAKNQKLLAQNFLVKSHLPVSLLNNSSINTNDVVYEIGPGTGMLTKELAKRAKRVIAIEKDRDLYIKLKRKFTLNDNVFLFNADFLHFRIQESHYKVFANIPFNITSAIMRRILYGKYTPSEAYLVMQREAAEKFSGRPAETQSSILSKPWFRLNIIKKFVATDFKPLPKVNVVLLHVEKRKKPLVSRKNAAIYQRFVKHGFSAWKRSLKVAYEPVFTYVQWRKLSRNLRFPFKATPTQLTFEQWLGLFCFYLRNVYDGKVKASVQPEWRSNGY
jgi:16S rRNA A1518/A1519 N6-dimethyltransferase RsmA/KsgA/DIM1 with predicted DNA glycosylase/AP lyase activity